MSGYRVVHNIALQLKPVISCLGYYAYTVQNYRYLDLLGVLCVCDGVALPDNQSYITENWLMKDQSGVFLTERGQNIARQTNVVYISTDAGDNWVPLHEFLDVSLGCLVGGIM